MNDPSAKCVQNFFKNVDDHLTKFEFCLKAALRPYVTGKAAFIPLDDKIPSGSYLKCHAVVGFVYNIYHPLCKINTNYLRPTHEKHFLNII